MPVKIRLARRGRKKAAMYDIVVADSRSPRDGKFIEKLGTYNPNTNPASINFDQDKAFKWVMNGAQPTDTVKTVLSHTGILFRKHLQIGVAKGALTQEQADSKFQTWKDEKEVKNQGKRDTLSQKKSDAAKATLENERKINEARAESLRKRSADAAKAAEPAAPAEEEAPETPAAEAPATEAPAAEEQA